MRKFLFVAVLASLPVIGHAIVVGPGECCGSSNGGATCEPGYSCYLEGGFGSDASCQPTELVVPNAGTNSGITSKIAKRKVLATTTNASKHPYGYKK
jgi:hypothetical protein